jgi:hypothetical protein
VSTQTSPSEGADHAVGAGPVGSAYAGSATVTGTPAADGPATAHAP